MISRERETETETERETETETETEIQRQRQTEIQRYTIPCHIIPDMYIRSYLIWTLGLKKKIWAHSTEKRTGFQSDLAFTPTWCGPKCGNIGRSFNSHIFIVVRYTLNTNQKLGNGPEFSFYPYQRDNHGFCHSNSRHLTISSVIFCVIFRVFQVMI